MAENPRLDLEKATEEYALREYEREVARDESLQTKAQFYLTFFTAFLTAIFLSQDQIKYLAGLLSNEDVFSVSKLLVGAALVLLTLGLLLTLGGVLYAFKVRAYEAPRPQQFTTELFPTQQRPTEQEAQGVQVRLHESSGRSYASATDSARGHNDDKAKGIRAASFGVIIAAVGLAILLSVSIIQQLYVDKPSPDEPTKVVVVTPIPATPITPR